MSTDEMQAIRKERGLLHSDNPTKSKKENSKNQKTTINAEKESNSRTIQIKFIKKEK